MIIRAATVLPVRDSREKAIVIQEASESPFFFFKATADDPNMSFPYFDNSIKPRETRNMLFVRNTTFTGTISLTRVNGQHSV